MKKLLQILLVICILASQVAMIAVVTPEDIELIKDLPLNKPTLGEFKNPTKIFLVASDNSSKRIDQNFEEGLKVSSDRTAVGVRDFINQFPYLSVDWDEVNRVVIISNAEDKILLPIDRKAVVKNGIKKTIEVPATIDMKSERTFLPLRSLCDELGFGIGYQEESRTIIITEPGFVYKGKEDPSVLTAEQILGPVADLLKSGELDPETLIKIDRSQKNNTSKTNNNNKINLPNKQEVPEGFIDITKPIDLVSRKVNLSSGTKSIDYADEISSELIYLINKERKSNHAGLLLENRNAKIFSDIRAGELIENQSNTRPDGSSFSEGNDIYGELILITNARDANDVFSSIKSNPNLLEAINNKEVTEISVSIAHNNNQNYVAIHMFQ